MPAGNPQPGEIWQPPDSRLANRIEHICRKMAWVVPVGEVDEATRNRLVPVAEIQNGWRHIDINNLDNLADVQPTGSGGVVINKAGLLRGRELTQHQAVGLAAWLIATADPSLTMFEDAIQVVRAKR